MSFYLLIFLFYIFFLYVTLSLCHSVSLIALSFFVILSLFHLFVAHSLPFFPFTFSYLFTVLSLYFLIFSCFLNVGLDILFVLYFNMGVFGAGVATLISQLISGALCLIYAIKSNSYFKLSRQNLRVNFLLMWKCIKIGIPLSLQFSLIAISCMALQRVVNSFGAVAVAAFAATSRVEQIIHMPYQTLSAALSTYCGQNFGAKKYDRMINGYRKAMLMMATFTICMIPVVQIFGHGIIRMFVKETSVIEMGAKAIKITSLFYIFLGMIYTVRGILNGMGDSFFCDAQRYCRSDWTLYCAIYFGCNSCNWCLGNMVVSRDGMVYGWNDGMVAISVYEKKDT